MAGVAITIIVGIYANLSNQIQYGEEDINAPDGGIVHGILDREIRRVSIPRHAGIALIAGGYPVAVIKAITAQIGAINQGIAGSEKADNKDVIITVEKRVVGVHYREIIGDGVTEHENVAIWIHGHRGAKIV